MSLPTNEEQELLEWINHLRADPSGEFDRLITDAATRTAISSDITNALRFFSVDLALFRTQMQAFSAVAPLAWSVELENAAAGHSAAMIAADTQSHQLPGEPGLGTRAQNAGYSFSTLGENVYAFASSVPFGHAGFVVDWGFGTGGMQTPPGHRNNLMNGNFTEIGIDVTHESNTATQVGPLVITQDLGSRFSYAPQVLGVVFTDGDNDAFYDAGEGKGGITVTLTGTGGTFTTTTWASGGYQIAVPQGSYTITFSGGVLTSAVSLATTLGSVNRKVDLNTSSIAPTATPSIPDLSAASDSGLSSTDNITNVTTPVFTGKAVALATVILFDGATQIGSGIADAAGDWSIKTSALAPGNHAVTAKATTAGGTSSASAALTIMIDTTAAAPTTPDLLAVSDSGLSAGDNITNVTTPSFAGKGEAGARITLFDGATAIGTGTVGVLGNWAVKTSALAAGTHSITARISDVAGNASLPSSVLTVTIDTTAPLAPTPPDLAAASDSGSSAGDNVTQVTAPTFVGKGEAGARVTLFDGATMIGTGTIGALGNWAVKASTLAEGVHSIIAKVTDTAGNVSLASSALPVTVDTSAPLPSTAPDLTAASDTGLSAGDNITNLTTLSFLGKGEAGARVTLFDGVTAIGTGTVGTLGNWAIKVSSLTTGLHSMTARLTDAAGNVSAASTALAVTIDTTAPAAPSAPDMTAVSDDGSSSTDNITTVTTPSFAGKGEAGARVTLFDGATVIGTGTVGALGNWAVKASALAVGAHAITAKLTDAAGNLSAASAALAVTIVPQPGLSAAIAEPLAAFVSAETIHASVDSTLADDAVLTFLSAASDAGLRLTGNGFANTIEGGVGDDVLTGLGGADILTGREGADVFAYRALADSSPGFADTIADFDLKAGDLIDLSGIDADVLSAGDQAFRLIGTAFTGAAGELRTQLNQAGTVVLADVDGDRAADFSLTLSGAQIACAQAFRL